MQTSETDVVAGDWDIQSVIETLLTRRWWIIASAAICGAVFLAAAMLMTPIYRAELVMVPASQDQGPLGGGLGQLGGLAALAGIDLNAAGTDVEESLAVLRSRQFSESFIEEEGLSSSLVSNGWVSRLREWAGLGDESTITDAYKYFDGEVRSIDRDTRTGLITLRIDWKDPVEAAQWANTLVGRLNREMRTRAKDDTSAALEYLRSELQNTSVIGTREAIIRLIEAQINQGMFASVTEEYAFRIIDQALPPESDDPLRPRPALMALLGAILGGFLGGLLALTYRRR